MGKEISIRFPAEYISYIARDNNEIAENCWWFVQIVTNYALYYEYTILAKKKLIAKDPSGKELIKIADKLGVIYKENTDKALKESLEVGKRHYSEAKNNDVKMAINHKLLFEWKDKWNLQDDFYKDCFVAYLAVRSLIGNRQYRPLCRNLILARMMGLPSLKSKDPKEQKAIDKLIEKSRIYNTYSKRYHFDKLKKQLIDYWHINYYVHARGYMIFGIGSRKQFQEAMKLIKEKRIRAKMHHDNSKDWQETDEEIPF